MGRHLQGLQRKIVFSFTLEPELVEKIEKLAWQEHKTKSALVQYILVAYLKAHESGNPNYPLEKFGAGFKAYPTIWDDAYVESLAGYSEEELEEMSRKAELFLQRIDAMKPKLKQPDKARLEIVLKRIYHIEKVLGAMDRILGDPKKIQKMQPEYSRRMYDDMKAMQAEYEKLVKERAEIVERISGKKIEQNVGN